MILDAHVHVLPGVDDGARDMAQSLRMLDAAQKCGVHTLAATPHAPRDEETLERMRNAYRRLYPEAKKRGVHLLLGFEVNWSMLPELTEARIREMCVSETRCMLLELPEGAPLPMEDAHLTRLLSHCVPVIAHPERCRYMRPDYARRLTELGCELALDASSLYLPFFARDRACARALYVAGLAAYVFSDAHDERDYEPFQKSLARYPAPGTGRLYRELQKRGEM